MVTGLFNSMLLVLRSAYFHNLGIQILYDQSTFFPIKTSTCTDIHHSEFLVFSYGPLNSTSVLTGARQGIDGIPVAWGWAGGISLNTGAGQKQIDSYLACVYPYKTFWYDQTKIINYTQKTNKQLPIISICCTKPIISKPCLDAGPCKIGEPFSTPGLGPTKLGLGLGRLSQREREN